MTFLGFCDSCFFAFVVRAAGKIVMTFSPYVLNFAGDLIVEFASKSILAKSAAAIRKERRRQKRSWKNLEKSAATIRKERRQRASRTVVYPG